MLEAVVVKLSRGSIAIALPTSDRIVFVLRLSLGALLPGKSLREWLAKAASTEEWQRPLHALDGFISVGFLTVPNRLNYIDLCLHLRSMESCDGFKNRLSPLSGHWLERGSSMSAVCLKWSLEPDESWKRSEVRKVPGYSPVEKDLKY